MGRLTPASTSTRALPMMEMARFDGVPPNMSVRTMTPLPVSQEQTSSRISCPSLFHVVVGADAYGRHGFLWADDMLQRCQERSRQSVVADYDETYHGASPALGNALTFLAALERLQFKK